MSFEPILINRACQSRHALERIADKWTCLIVYALLDGRRGHGELKRMVEGISQKMLTQTLSSMEADGFTRTVIDVIPPHVEYGPTPLGQTLSDPLVAICEWAMAHLPELQAAREANSRKAALT